MLALSSETESLIATRQLGTPKQIYKPNTVAAIIMGLFFMLFAFIWIVAALFITGSALLFTGLTPFQTPGFPSFSGTASPFSTIFSILGIVFPLFGLLFVGLGLRMIISARLNRNVRAVLCEHGLVYRGRNGTDAFRWEEVATVIDKVHVDTSTTQQSNGFSNTSTTISHSYTVACKDGRRFRFDRILGKVEQLGEEIQIAVALSQKSV